MERVEAINTIPLPRHNKVVQYFFGNINFIQRFDIPKFTEITKDITNMLKKGMVGIEFPLSRLRRDFFL
jgi:hypothetical protein